MKINLIKIVAISTMLFSGTNLWLSKKREKFCDEMLAQASTEIESADQTAVYQHIHSALVFEPNNPLLWEMLAKLCVRDADLDVRSLFRAPVLLSQSRASKLEEADEALQRAELLQDNDAGLHYERSWVLSILGREEEANAENERARQIQPTNGGFLIEAAVRAEQVHDQWSYEDYLSHAIALEPSLLNSLWFDDVRKSDKASADRVLQNAIAILAPKTGATAEARRGSLRLAAGDFAGSIKDLSAALSSSPNYPKTWGKLG